MNTNKMYSQNSKLIDTASKLLLYAGIGIGVWFVGKKIANAMKLASLTNSLAAQAENAVASDTDVISEERAETIAESLWLAMEGNGTNEKSVMSLLRSLPNNTSLALVNAKFGYRAYGFTGSPMFGKGTDCNLYTWLHKELSGDNLTEVENMFAKAGISGF